MLDEGFEDMQNEEPQMCQGGCGSRGYDDWDLGPNDGTFWCCDCLKRHYPLDKVPQEWVIEDE